MLIIDSLEEMKSFSKDTKSLGKTIGFVPTMGSLHQGHLSLVDRAVSECDAVFVSIYVNPTQFSTLQEAAEYPRDLKKDLLYCIERKVDVVFTPSSRDMYPENFSTFVEVEGLSDILCGASNPSHFKGVTTIVLKLFNIVKPDKAYFGLKDYQQYVIVSKMVEELNMDVSVIGCSTVREESGLAMSSRNQLLSEKGRERASIIYRSLKASKRLFHEGVENLDILKDEILKRLMKENVRLDYVEIVDSYSLKPVQKINQKDIVLISVFVDRIRLIDNIQLF
jgi:pantoate--beta-alanine ligase